MAKQLVLRNSEGRIIVAPCLYASARHGAMLGENYREISFRSGGKAIHHIRHRQRSLELPDLMHLLKAASDIPSPTIAADSRSLSTVNSLRIDGQDVVAGDRVEVRSAEATAMRISPGVWTASSARSLVLTNAPVWQLQSAWGLGTPWSFRVLSNGNLQGLGALTRSNVVATQKNAGAPVTNPARFGSGLWQNVGQLSATWQGLKVTFDELSVRRLALRVTSQRMNYDTKFPIAEMSINISGWGDASTFYNYETGVRQSGGMAIWSYGQEQIWVSQNLEPAKVCSWLGTNDEGMSRSTIALEMYGDVPCRIKIGNEFPSNGSTVILPPGVADSLFPSIGAGNFTVINNDGLTPWILARA